MYTLNFDLSFPGVKTMAPKNKDGTKYIISTSKDKAIKKWYESGIYHIAISFTDKTIKRAYTLTNKTIREIVSYLSNLDDKKSRMALENFSYFMKDYFEIMGSNTIVNGFKELVNSEYSYFGGYVDVYVSEVEDE